MQRPWLRRGWPQQARALSPLLLGVLQVSRPAPALQSVYIFCVFVIFVQHVHMLYTSIEYLFIYILCLHNRSGGHAGQPSASRHAIHASCVELSTTAVIVYEM